MPDGMGVDAGDPDGDGRPDFVVTNFDNECHALHLNPGRLPFREASVESGPAASSVAYVGWGVRMLDYNNDGIVDLFIVNGHLREMISRSNRAVSYLACACSARSPTGTPSARASHCASAVARSLAGSPAAAVFSRPMTAAWSSAWAVMAFPESWKSAGPRDVCGALEAPAPGLYHDITEPTAPRKSV